MKIAPPPSAKIVMHADGLGTPSPDTVRERARELAQINGHQDVTPVDWQQARREVHGGCVDSNGDHDETLAVSERDMIAIDPGHHVKNLREGDDSPAEELVAEGLEEAQHDQMLAAVRRDLAEDFAE